MVNWKQLFSEIAWEIYRSVKPILHTHQAEEIVGRGTGGDLTRHIDALAEDVAIKILEKSGVSCILVSEECGTRVIGEEAKDYVVLDSVDGTTNALRGISFFSTSLALSTGPHLSNVKLGLVMDLNNSTIFLAEKDKGAYEGESRLRPSSVTNIDDALISVEVSLPGNKEHIIRLIPLITKTGKIRHLGSTALELCYVASGSLDAFVDTRNLIRATDLSAAYLILREAGGVIATPEGGKLDMELKAMERTSFVAAANPTIYDNIIKLLK